MLHSELAEAAALLLELPRPPGIAGHTTTLTDNSNKHFDAKENLLFLLCCAGRSVAECWGEVPGIGSGTCRLWTQSGVEMSAVVHTAAFHCQLTLTECQHNTGRCRYCTPYTRPAHSLDKSGTTDTENNTTAHSAVVFHHIITDY